LESLHSRLLSFKDVYLPIDCSVKQDILQTGGLVLDPSGAMGDNPHRSSNAIAVQVNLKVLLENMVTLGSPRNDNL
jgi:hypothetical protein